jgi:immune inhibitor A
MWWSNRGDSGHSTLTRTLDLRNVSSATLQFRLWYDIEADYDYGFVGVSTDGGKTYTSLQGRHTTTEDPQGANWGNGYTGTSGGGDVAEWVDEQIDLTPYVGKEVVLRFSLVTDDAFNKPGMIIDNIRVPEINFSDDAESDSAGWTAAGFARTNNLLPQQWEVRLVRIQGRTVSFEPLQLDAQQRGEYRLEAGERGALIVMATTPHTTERASYTISLTTP